MVRMLAAAALALSAVPAQSQPLPEITLRIAGHAVRAEVAHTDATRTKGLMFRKSMKDGDGMLFVFAEQAFHSMWMQNTYLPLSVAFIDHEGVILNIADMQPQTTNPHSAAGLAKYALEMNQGWFSRRGIKAGAKIDGIGKAPPAQ